jgi:isopentenyl-diphosphate Delta-isomerase
MSDLIPAWVNGSLQPVEKLAVHRRGLRHKAVSVFLLRDSQVLIQRRAAGKYHTPGLWANTCCTHPHWGESDADCAQRRLKEELGIEGLPLTPVHEVEYRADVGGGMTEHEVVRIFRGEAPADLPLRPAPARGGRVALDRPAGVGRRDRARARPLHPLAADLPGRAHGRHLRARSRAGPAGGPGAAPPAECHTFLNRWPCSRIGAIFRRETRKTGGTEAEAAHP